MTSGREDETNEVGTCVVSELHEFQAGRLKKIVDNWKKLTSDSKVLDIIQNCLVILSLMKIKKLI